MGEFGDYLEEIDDVEPGDNGQLQYNNVNMNRDNEPGNEEVVEGDNNDVIDRRWVNVDQSNILPGRTRGVHIDFNELLTGEGT